MLNGERKRVLRRKEFCRYSRSLDQYFSKIPEFRSTIYRILGMCPNNAVTEVLRQSDLGIWHTPCCSCSYQPYKRHYTDLEVQISSIAVLSKLAMALTLIFD